MAATAGVGNGVAGVAVGMGVDVDGPPQAKVRPATMQSMTVAVVHRSFLLISSCANTFIATIPLFAERVCYVRR